MKHKATVIGKRIMTVMLSLVMVAGVFAGMKLDVKAAGYYTVNVTVPEEIAKAKLQTYQPGDTLNFTGVFAPDNKNYIFEIRYEFYVCNQYSGSQLRWSGASGEGNKDKEFAYSLTLSNEWKYSNYEYQLLSTDLPIKSTEGSGPVIITTVFKVIVYDTDISVSSEDVVAPSHECNFQWVTTIDPSAGVDGLEEYKCVYCGAVRESHAIPAGIAYVKALYGDVKNAPANSSITYDSGRLYTISDYLLKKMAERNDVTVIVSFEYQNAKYELTFPAGTDYTPVLTDEDTMYGYFGVAAKLGLTVVAK